mmetsp:Transcript_80298/g.210889  ORF Transcript_80298/g.210889 Transcript_80298/m.210889 type:complete len:494 (+) Transcript_80298:42-1523(+)
MVERMSNGSCSSGPAPAPAPGMYAPSAPWAPSPAPPFEMTILERLKLNSQRMGTVAASLLDVQGGLSVAQQEALDKVFDISNIEGFLHKHEHLMDEGKLLDAQRIGLVRQAEALTRQLTAERAEATVSKALVPELAKHNATRHLYTLVNKQLIEANLKLGEALKSAELGDKGTAASLEAAEAELKAQRKITSDLQLQVVQAQKRMRSCQKELGDVEGDLGKLDAAAIRAKNRTRTMEASAGKEQQKVVMQLEALKKRLFKSRANSAMMQSQQVLIQEKFGALEQAGKARIKQMRNQWGSIIGKVKADEIMLAAQHKMRKELEDTIAYVASQVKDLEARLASGHLAILHANNTQLKTQLTQINGQLVQSQETLRTHRLLTMRSNLTASSLEREVQDNSALAQRVTAASLAQIEADKKAASELILWAERATMVAESAKLSDCSDLWDRENQPTVDELRECKRVPSDLSASKAQVVALSGALGKELGRMAALQLER